MIPMEKQVSTWEQGRELFKSGVRRNSNFYWVNEAEREMDPVSFILVTRENVMEIIEQEIICRKELSDSLSGSDYAAAKEALIQETFDTMIGSAENDQLYSAFTHSELLTVFAKTRLPINPAEMLTATGTSDELMEGLYKKVLSAEFVNQIIA